MADARRYLERTELDRLVHGDIEMVDAPRDFIESGEHRDRVIDDLGMGRAQAKHKRERQEAEPVADQPRRLVFRLFRHATHRLGPSDVPSGVPPAASRTFS